MKLLATIMMALLTVYSAEASEKPRTGDDARNGDPKKFQFDVRPGGTLYLDIDRGTINVESSMENTVFVELDREIRGVSAEEEKTILERHEYDVSKDGNNVVIESRFDEDGSDSWSWRNSRRNRNFRLTITVRVPVNYNVNFESGAGNIDVADLRGEVSGRTGAGNVTIGRIDGPVDVSSGAGNIDVQSVVGYVDVRSGAGNITIDEVAGEINAHTGAGNVVATVTRQPREDSELNSGAGNVTVYLADNIAVDVEARSSLGSASCEFDLAIRGKWMSKSFGGRINGGGPALTLHSGVGNVNLLRH
jgi:DUF4097 and DUF4098 domain-containing protein YvlB